MTAREVEIEQALAFGRSWEWMTARWPEDDIEAAWQRIQDAHRNSTDRDDELEQPAAPIPPPRAVVVDGVTLAPCGTVTAHRRHIRRNEPVDPACVEAVRRFNAERRARTAAARAARGGTPRPNDEEEQQFQRLAREGKTTPDIAAIMRTTERHVKRIRDRLASRDRRGRVRNRVTILNCPECGRRFDTPMGVGGHRSKAHKGTAA